MMLKDVETFYIFSFLSKFLGIVELILDFKYFT